MLEDKEKLCAQRKAECKDESNAFNKHLKFSGYKLDNSSSCTVTSSAHCRFSNFTADSWAPVVGFATLIAALLAAVHKGLGL